MVFKDELVPLVGCRPGTRDPWGAAVQAGLQTRPLCSNLTRAATAGAYLAPYRICALRRSCLDPKLEARLQEETLGLLPRSMSYFYADPSIFSLQIHNVPECEDEGVRGRSKEKRMDESSVEDGERRRRSGGSKRSRHRHFIDLDEGGRKMRKERRKMTSHRHSDDSDAFVECEEGEKRSWGETRDEDDERRRRRRSRMDRRCCIHSDNSDEGGKKIGKEKRKRESHRHSDESGVSEASFSECTAGEKSSSRGRTSHRHQSAYLDASEDFSRRHKTKKTI